MIARWRGQTDDRTIARPVSGHDRAVRAIALTIVAATVSSACSFVAARSAPHGTGKASTRAPTCASYVVPLADLGLGVGLAAMGRIGDACENSDNAGDCFSRAETRRTVMWSIAGVLLVSAVYGTAAIARCRTRDGT